MDQLKRMAFEKAKKEIMDEEGQFMDQCRLVAIALKHYYDSLIEQGFTPYQSLQIVIAHGTTPGVNNTNKG